MINRLKKKYFDLVKAKQTFKGSAEYWEQRYKEGKNSGSGSYSNLAHFKAELLNNFIEKNSIDSVIEYGCGDGNQLTLANYTNYIGLDISNTTLDNCKQKFANDDSKEFYLYPDQAILDGEPIFKADLSLSLDVIYHLIEDKVFENHIKHVFQSSKKNVIIYSSNFDSKQIYHVKHRNFTKWIEQNISNWKLKECIPNKYPYHAKNEDHTSLADFYIYEKK